MSANNNSQSLTIKRTIFLFVPYIIKDTRIKIDLNFIKNVFHKCIDCRKNSVIEVSIVLVC